MDTQIAAGFVGYTSPSLSTLLDRELGVSTGKARPPDRLAQATADRHGSSPTPPTTSPISWSSTTGSPRSWPRGVGPSGSRRPVRNSGSTRVAPATPMRPGGASRKSVTSRDRDSPLAQAVAGWRERRAAAVGPHPPLRPVGPRCRVCRHLGADHRRGAPGPARRGRTGAQGRRGRGTPTDRGGLQGSPADRPLPATGRRAVLGAATGRSADLGLGEPAARGTCDLETALLATRSDLEELLRGSPDARLARGWRAEIVGEPIRRLVAGEAALGLRPGKRSASRRHLIPSRTVGPEPMSLP